MQLDLGDIIAEFNFRIKGRRSRIVWHIGAAAESTAKGRPGEPGININPRRVDLLMDLMADKQVTATLEFTDEMGNPTGTTEDFTAQFSTDREDLVSLTDNGDGSCVIAAVGTLGQANVHVDVSAGAQQLTGDLQVNVVAGMAERINVVVGEPEEVTPDSTI